MQAWFTIAEIVARYILSDKYDKYWLAISLRVIVDDYFNIKITQML